jgi:CheY-like chemotaxis protein
MTDDTVPRALVVDDDALIRMDAADILIDAGFRPYEASGADDAITILEDSAGQIQLLLTDVQMPGGRDGFALARDCAYRWPHIEMLVAVRCSSANRSVPR